NEVNNCVVNTSSLTVTLPDLVETAVQDPPPSANAGQSFTATDAVANKGQVSAAASTTRYYLVQGTARILLTGSRSIPSLEGISCFGCGSQGSATVTIPTTTPAGTYNLQACADDLHAVAETDETNNCTVSTGTMTVSGTGTFDLSPTAATALPDELVLYRFTWIAPTVWSDLASLDLR